MKRYLTMILVAVIVLSTSMHISGRAYESTEYQYNEIENIEAVKNEPIANEISNDEVIENSIIIGNGAEEQIKTIFVDRYSTYYFYNLRNNFGYNYIGSCSYTAAAMLLSFYDTYWDDRIIPENYEEVITNFNKNLPIAEITNSPGIIREPYKMITDKKKSERIAYDQRLPIDKYQDLISMYKNDYFHLYLMDMALTNNIDVDKDLAIFPSEIKSLLEYYLYNVLNYDVVDVEVEHITGFENVRAYAIDKVQQGIPVIVSGTSINNGAHTYIIYDYNAVEDELYCHLGWYKDNLLDKEYTHVAFSTIYYTLFEGAVSLDFKTEHSCSNNYTYVEDGETKSKCSCYFPCHDAHVHEYELSADELQHTYVCGCHVNDSNYYNHTFEYKSVDSQTHMLECSECKYSYTAEHNMRFKAYAVSGKHGYECLDCGYVDEDSLESHSYDYWVYLNPTTHISECGCGARGTTTSNHVFTFPDDEGEMICRGCAYTKYLGRDGGLIILSKQKVSLNGSYILPDGNIVLVEEDIEAYLNGTLVFYDKDNLPVTQ